MVTLLEDPSILVEEHPGVPPTVQVVPVNPFVHKHEQMPEDMVLVPPFWH